MKALVTTATALLVLSGCGHSPPTRFFTLDPRAPSTNPAVGSIAPVQLDAVHIPATLDRPQLVTQSAPDRLVIDEQNQWGAPLGELMRRTLAQDLLARLPRETFIPPGAPTPAGARGLVVDVLQLQSQANGDVILQATWTLMNPGHGGVAMSRNVRFSARSGSGPGGQAAAISNLLGQLADQLTAALASDELRPAPPVSR